MIIRISEHKKIEVQKQQERNTQPFEKFLDVPKKIFVLFHQLSVFFMESITKLFFVCTEGFILLYHCTVYVVSNPN
jgi:hypothetical protein